MNPRTFLGGCGIGIALTLSYTWQPLAPAHIQGLYLRILPVSTVAGGALLDLIAASLLCWGVLAILERVDVVGKTLLWTLLTALVPAIVVRSALRLSELNVVVPSTLLLAAAFFLPALILRRFFPVGYSRFVAAFRGLYLSAGVCILWVIPELVYGATHHQQPDAMQTMRVASSGPTHSANSNTHIVWLLLDELSYDQTFDHPQPELKLANFNALRDVSTSFTDVQPEGYNTDEILPALLSGHKVSDIGSSMDGALRVRESSGTGWTRFNPQATLFGDAQRLGWSTGIAGWFNPYCRLFGDVVDSCQWEPESRAFPGHMSAANSAWQNALAPLGAKFRVDSDSTLEAQHRKAYPSLLDRGLNLVRDGKQRFIFVHLPVPHPPGIYNRATRQLRDGGSYLDNLVLADDTVRVVRAAIDQSAAAQSTILIVSSDHSMRVAKWRGSASWTAEDERVFGKRFDPRPVLLVHFPDETNGQTISAPFQELREHDLIDDLLTGKIRSEPDLQAWIRVESSSGQ